MTKLTKTISRETDVLVRDGNKFGKLMVSMSPPGLLRLRIKGCKKTYVLPLAHCYYAAVKAHVEAKRKEKKKKKKRVKRNLRHGKKSCKKTKK